MYYLFLLTDVKAANFDKKFVNITLHVINFGIYYYVFCDELKILNFEINGTHAFLFPH